MDRKGPQASELTKTKISPNSPVCTNFITNLRFIRIRLQEHEDLDREEFFQNGFGQNKKKFTGKAISTLNWNFK